MDLEPDDSSPADLSRERAPKRRRLNNTREAEPPATSLPRNTTHASATRSVDGWSASDEFIRVHGHGTNPGTSNLQDASLSSSYAIGTESGGSNRNSGASPALESTSTAYGTSAGPSSDAQRLLQPSTPATGPGSEFSLPGDRNLPFGLLYNAQLGSSTNATHATSGQSHGEQASVPTQPALDDLEAIDLTAVNDGPALRRREELDDESRRLRREASLKIEARRKANAQMMKSTLEEQQASSSKADSPAGKQGLGGTSCVICMDSFTDMTATHCGHLFCHTCINEVLITAEMARSYPATKVRLASPHSFRW